MSRRGITILEMLVATFIVAIAAGAVTKAFVSSLTFENNFVKTVEARNTRARLEDSLTRVVCGADLVGANRYLVSPVTTSQSGMQQSPPDGGLGAGSSSLALTTTSEELPARYLKATDGDFHDLNEQYGALGGAAEIALSTVPTGDAGAKTGLFFREQRPPDTEVSRGGKERILDPNVRDIRFEFYDGSDWLMSWDSRSTQKDKLPTAVRVTYLFAEDPSPHIFIIRLPLAGAKPPPQNQGGQS